MKYVGCHFTLAMDPSVDICVQINHTIITTRYFVYRIIRVPHYGLNVLETIYA
jgi:hypothetical protein